jgi:hypothetical protein
MNQRPTSSEPASSGALAILESSVLIRVAGSVLGAIRRGSKDAALLAPARAVVATWQELSVPARQYACGVALIAAGATFTGLALWKQDPPGWVWTVVPALAIVIGGVLVASVPDTKTVDE